MRKGYETSDNAAFIRRWFEEVWNKGSEEAIDEMFAEDGVAHGLGDGPDQDIRGASGFKPFFHSFRGAFPDLEVVVEDTVSEGDRVAARCSVRAKHTGHTLGFDATHRPVEFHGICIVRLRDGQIVEAWNNFDFMGMFRQLGALRLDAPAAGPPADEALPSTD
jgi:steroid delta-isomerase-like uncharacterized protein